MQTTRIALFLALVTILHKSHHVAASPFKSGHHAFHADFKKGFLEQMTSHFSNSVDYLFKSQAFSSPVFQRPGLAKLLKTQSDRHWEEGISFTKKYIQRQGPADDTAFLKAISIDIKVNKSDEDFPKADGIQTFYLNRYKDQMETLVTNAKTRVETINSCLNHMSTLHRDGDLVHFLEERMEKEAEGLLEFQVQDSVLGVMKDNSQGVHLFDASLL